MDIKDERIDGGKAFDWGRTSGDYARFRDIYPTEFYEKIAACGIGISGQSVLDLGTGTGVLPRNMCRFGAKWTGTDISPEQIEQAKKLSQGMDISYYAMPAEKTDFPDASFDAATACQCFWYFDHENLVPQLCRMLKSDGRFLVLCMEWLPYEDKIAGMSEDLVRKYSPNWSGGGETMHTIEIPACYGERFELVHHEEWKLKVHFTRESWNGRMKACRGIGASLTPEEIENWEREHLRMLRENAPEEFDILHFAAMAELRKKDR